MCARPRALDDRPFVPAETLPLFHREVRERLSPTALQLLLDRAEIFVEGSAARGSSAHGAFLGTAMVTLDLAAAADRVRPLSDGAMRLCAAFADEPEARRAIVARVLEAARSRLASPGPLRASAPRFRVDGDRVLVDFDLDGEQP
jgi:hypothetical protein